MRGEPNAAGVVAGFAEINGARLYYESAGQGPPLVLVHAGIADLRMWDGQFEPFAEHHRTVSGFRSEGPEPPQWKDIVAAFRAGDLAESARLEAELWVVGSRPSPEDVDASVLARVREMDEIALATEKDRDRLEQQLETPSIERLAEIAAPTLIVVGDADTEEMLEAADLLAREITGARKVVIRDAGHLPNLEHPEEFNRLVLGFLAAP